MTLKIMESTTSINSLKILFCLLTSLSACSESKSPTTSAKAPSSVANVCREAITTAVKEMGYKPNATVESLFSNQFSSFEENSYSRNPNGLEQLKIGVEADYGGTGLTWFTCEVSPSGAVKIIKKE